MFNRNLLKISIVLLSILFAYFIIKAPEYTTLISLPIILSIIVCFYFLDLLSHIRKRSILMDEDDKEVVVIRNNDLNDER
mgnify:CR=1 FL=1